LQVKLFLNRAIMLNISIVLYKHSTEEITQQIDFLKKSSVVKNIFLIDNSPSENKKLQNIEKVTYIFNNKNFGYGKAHNIAIRKTMDDKVEYHLVLNPDVEFADNILSIIEDYMSNNEDVGLLLPKILSPDGKLQYQCKLLPTPVDLLFRRFLPAKWIQKRQYRYEMRASGYNKIMVAPYLQGCFMFFRTKTLEATGLFDERFFMYPEDIDITRRIYRKYKTIYFPLATIIHRHERASYKSFKMLMIHIINIIKYFNKWGWFIDHERTIINREVEMRLANDCSTWNNSILSAEQN
jgi:GT2 family glycosyltransferase